MGRSPRAPGAIGSDDYTGFSLILIGVGLAILGWAAWKMWHAEISTGALIVAHREMQAIGWFGGDQGFRLGPRHHGRASFYHAGPHVGPERGAS